MCLRRHWGVVDFWGIYGPSLAQIWRGFVKWRKLTFALGTDRERGRGDGLWWGLMKFGKIHHTGTENDLRRGVVADAEKG